MAATLVGASRRRRPVLLLAVLAAATLAALLGWGLAPRGASTTPATGAAVGAPAPPLALPRLDGGRADLSAEHGRVVLLNFWATWCAPCRAEMPGLQRLADDLRDAPFALYAIDLQEDAPTIEPFMRQLDLHLGVLLDAEGTATRAYNVRALPATFLVDQRGVLRRQRLGPLADGEAGTEWSGAWLAEQVRALLAAG